MRIVVDPGATADRVELRHAHDFGSFDVLVLGDVSPEQVRGELESVGRLETDGHAFVRVPALLALAGQRAHSTDWRQGFEKMLSFAESHGYVDARGDVRAHVIWERTLIDTARFRKTLGYFPTGVTVLTAHTELGPEGMTCNSFSSVSLEPPLLAVYPAKTSTTWPLLSAAGGFCVNVLSEGQGDLATRFATRGVDRFEGTNWTHRSCGPALSGVSAWIECQIDSERDAGDHFVVLARVLHMETGGDGAPLIFYRGEFGTFATRGFE